VVSIATFP